MDDLHNDEQRPRASLHGKGRNILLGQTGDDESPVEKQAARITAPESPDVQGANPDASSLLLTPEETDALLDFSPDSPAYRSDFAFTTPHRVEVELASEEPSVELSELSDDVPDWLRVDQAAPLSYEADSALADFVEEGVPIAERIAEPDDQFFYPSYDPPVEVEALTPDGPEQWPGEPAGDPVATVRDVEDPGGEVLTDFQPAAPDEEGGVYVPQTATPEPEVTAASPANIGDPFPALPRQASEELFRSTPLPDKGMLDTLVNDDRVQKLWMQIEALHEELVEVVKGDRTATDAYQRELLQASGMLLESRHNYDDARAIVYRIRADINRQRKVEADVMRYRPLLLNYYIGWLVALVVLFLLKQLFAGIVEAVGVNVFAALYYPVLLGAVGALVSGYLTLDRHTTKLRDFDPLHITWYLFNPLLGGVMGLLMFLLASVANEDLLQETASRGEVAITYLLCVLAGMNQNNVLRRLNELMDRFNSGGK